MRERERERERTRERERERERNVKENMDRINSMSQFPIVKEFFFFCARENMEFFLPSSNFIDKTDIVINQFFYTRQTPKIYNTVHGRDSQKIGYKPVILHIIE